MILAFKQFSGEIPKLPPHLLPDNNAQDAVDCDFSHGELRALKQPFELFTASNTPKSIYTQDGLRYFTWPFDVNAIKSLTIDDIHDRVYFTTPTDFRVTSYATAKVNGGEPSTSYRVGVPVPAAAPALLITPKSTLPVSYQFRFFYELGGVKYQEGDIAVAVVDPGRKYSFTPPAKATATVSGTGLADAVFAVTEYSYTEKPIQDPPVIRGKKFGTTNADINDAKVQQVQIVGQNLIKILTGTFAGQFDDADTLVTQDGVRHDTKTLYEIALYTDMRDVNVVTQGTTTGGGTTPSGAFAALEIIGTDTATGVKTFDIYSSNSSFAKPNSIVATLANGANGTMTVSLTYEGEEFAKEDRAYIYTLVNTYDEEGAPSLPASTTIDFLQEVQVTVVTPETVNYAPIKAMRIYRTVTGSTGIAEYHLVTEIPCLGRIGNTIFMDTITAEKLGEPISSLNNYPPDIGLRGLAASPNGFVVAFKGNELHASEAYKLFAWPKAYVVPFPHNIVSVTAHGNGFLITTTGYPYIVSGVTPDSLSASKLPVMQAGANKNAVTPVDGGIIYASHDGLVAVSGASASLLGSQAFFTREDWRARYGAKLSTLRLASHDGFVIGWFPDANGFVIRLDEAEGTYTKLSDTANCDAILPQTDGLYFAAGNKVYQFQGGSPKPLIWQSRDVILPKPINFGAGHFIGSGSFTLSFYSDGQIRYSQSVTGDRFFRMPAGFKARRFSVRITGTGTVKELYVAETMTELARA